MSNYVLPSARSDRRWQVPALVFVYLGLIVAAVVFYGQVLEADIVLNEDHQEAVHASCGHETRRLESVSVAEAIQHSKSQWMIFPVISIILLVASIPLFLYHLLGEQGTAKAIAFAAVLLIVVVFEVIWAIGAIRSILVPEQHLKYLLWMLGTLVGYEAVAGLSYHRCKLGRQMKRLLVQFDGPALVVFAGLFFWVTEYDQVVHVLLEPGANRELWPSEIFRAEDVLIAGFTGFHLAITSILVGGEAWKLSRADDG